jgi:plastocyanin
MKKSGLVVGLLALVILGAGIIWLIVNKSATPANNNSSSNTSSSSSDQTQSGTVAVVMQNKAFSPQHIKVKKGTKVTWTNNDSVRHNVVADDASNAAGLPTDNTLLGKGESYSFTFNTVGTFAYHCVPHPFMTGTVEVVE